MVMVEFEALERQGLALLGHPADAVITRIRRNFYGASIRVRSEASGLDAHVKANPSGFANEAGILSHFRQAGLGGRFPELLASSPDGSVVATRTSGEPMREMFKGKTNLPFDGKPVVHHLCDALSALVEAQANASNSELLAMNADHFPTAELPGILERLGRDGLEDSAMGDEERSALSIMVRRWIPVAEKLARLELGDAWEHGDFGSGNVLLSLGSPRKAVLIDLSESAVMSPCFSASQFIWRLRGHLGIDPQGAEDQALRASWGSRAAELLGLPKARLDAGLDLCDRLHVAYGLLIGRRFAKAHREHAGSKFDNPAVHGLVEASRHA